MVSKRSFKLLVESRTTPFVAVVQIIYFHDCSSLNYLSYGTSIISTPNACKIELVFYNKEKNNWHYNVLLRYNLWNQTISSTVVIKEKYIQRTDIYCIRWEMTLLFNKGNLYFSKTAAVC